MGLGELGLGEMGQNRLEISHDPQTSVSIYCELLTIFVGDLLGR